MNLLVIGSGGREHALAWRLAQSPRIARVYVAPGNGGTQAEDGVINADASGVAQLLDLAKQHSVALSVVGPEAPLADGVVDAFRGEGLKIYGPTRRAAQLESSKDFAKSFMVRHGIPTAKHQTFTDAVAAHAYLDTQGTPIVLKADGLAAGKGVIVATTLEDAHHGVEQLMVSGMVGNAGNRLVIEEFIDGEEVSFIVMVDGQHILPLATSQDHKRLHDGDRGPNTGGMGAYSPAPLVTPSLHARIMREVIQPTVAGMHADGEAYTGFLYAGLMITPKGDIKVLEYNCRLGDPETQPILMRLKTDLFTLIEHGVNGTLHSVEAQWDRRVGLGVVLAAAGYPEHPRKGDVITGLPEAAEDVHVFHAGTRKQGDQILTQGGRVLCVTALGDTVRLAQRRAYEIADQIKFDGKQMRRDIGH
ncbi:MAG: phosphoribosylamine--glycine ligase, partial [Betaproteobacteria bacterium]|nr:phosphoribosylamine--glycine ligase [Betaproteobacteria bacterium]